MLARRVPTCARARGPTRPRRHTKRARPPDIALELAPPMGLRTWTVRTRSGPRTGRHLREPGNRRDPLGSDKIGSRRQGGRTGPLGSPQPPHRGSPEANWADRVARSQRGGALPEPMAQGRKEPLERGASGGRERRPKNVLATSERHTKGGAQASRV